MSKHNRETCKVCNRLRSRYDNLGEIQHPDEAVLFIEHAPHWKEKKEERKKRQREEPTQSNTIISMFKSK